MKDREVIYVTIWSIKFVIEGQMMSSNYKYSNVDVIIKGINVTFNILTVTLHVHMSNLYTRKSLKLREM